MRIMCVAGVRRLWAIAAAALLAGGCDVPPDEEARLGDETAQELGAQLPLVTDSYVNSYVNELGDTIASRTSRSDLDWHFYVVNSHQINAFALPGGHIFVNRGLIEATDRMDQLAGVLGHEIGHVIQRHSVEQMKNQQTVGIVASLACALTSLCESQVGEAAINIGGTALVARHSRQDEFEADSEAVANVLEVSIDPEGIPSMFEVLMERRQAEPTIVDGWFASHPLEESRIENARSLIETAGADRTAALARDIPSYAEFRRRVSMLPEPPSPPSARDRQR